MSKTNLPLGIIDIMRLMLEYVPVSSPSHAGEFRGRSISLQSPVQLLQSMVCNLDNSCHQDIDEDQVFAYPGAK